MNLDTATMGENLKAVLVFWLFLSVIATPFGFLVAFLVKRIVPMVRVLLAAIVAGYVVSVVIIFVILRALLPDQTLNLYGALVASVVISGGIIFLIAYIIRRTLLSRVPDLQADQSFSVFGEDVRNKPKSARRHKKR